MDILKFLLIFILIVVGLKLLQIILVWKNLMNFSYKFTYPKLTEQDDPPSDVASIYKEAETVLINQGFSFLYSFTMLNSLTNQEVFNQVYQDISQKIFAFVHIREDINYPLPFQITYESYLSNGEVVTTRDGIQQNDLEYQPDFHISDGYFANPDSQLKFHQQSVEEITNKTQTYTIILNKETSIQKEKEMLDKLIVYWKDKYFKTAEDGSYVLRAFEAIKLTFRIISKNRKKAEMLKSAGKYEINNFEAFIDADIAQLEAMKYIESNKSKNKAGYIFSLLVSLILFVLLFGYLISWEIIPIILVILIIHELGHWIGMKMFGYGDSKIFFVPLLGAVTTGYKEDATPFQKLTILLLGPIPGIIIGIVLLLIHNSNPDELFLRAGILFFIVNYINLLPISPLDGGKIVEMFISHRFPLLTFVFVLISAMVLLGSGLIMTDPILIGVGFIMLITTINSWKDYKAKKALKAVISDEDDEKLITKKIIKYIYNLSSGINIQNRFHSIKLLKMHFLSPVPRKLQAITGTGIYFIALILPLIAVIFHFFFNVIFFSVFTGINDDWHKQLAEAVTPGEKIEVCYQAGTQFMIYAAPDSAVKYFEQAVVLSDSFDIKNRQYIDANMRLSELESDTSKIREYLYTSLRTAEEIYNESDITAADIFSEAGSPRFKFIGVPMIERYLRKAIRIYNEQGNLLEVSSVKRNLADIIAKNGNIEDAESLLIETLDTYEMEIDSFYEPFAGVHILADLYSESGRDSMALDLLNEYEIRFIKFYTGNKDFPVPAADLISHRGWIYLGQNDLDNARSSFIRAGNFFDSIYDEDIYSYYKKDYILDLCYLELRENNIDNTRREFKHIESEFSKEYFENYYEENEYNGGYYPSNVRQTWRENRRIAHKKIIKTLLDMN